MDISDRIKEEFSPVAIIAAVVLALFMTVQTLSLIHDQEHAQDDHSRNGVECLFCLATLTDDDDDPIVAGGMIGLTSILWIASQADEPISAWSEPQQRNRPRGPPRA